VDQSTARLLVRQLRHRSPSLVPVAITEEHMRGQWDKPDSEWIVLATASRMVFRAVPDNMNLDEPIAELGD
jgi:hypothetical protein